MLSLNKKFLFIHIPKTGGNSIASILWKYSEDIIINHDHAVFEEIPDYFELINPDYPSLKKHSTLMDYRKVIGDQVFKRLYKFACVRNPWERMISLYFYKSGKGRFNDWSRTDFIELAKRSRPAMKYLTTKGGGRLAKVLPRQQRWKRIFGIQPEVDFIIRFENLQSDFDKLCENIGISKVMLPHKNKSQRKNYVNYYDDELIEIVKELFIDDIQEFGYRFPR